MGNVLYKLCRENQNICFILKKFNIKWCPSWDNVEKYGKARRATIILYIEQSSNTTFSMYLTL